MDRIGLQTLRDELAADAAEAELALSHARERMEIPGPAGHEAAAFHLVRLYNIIEQMALRVAKAFENHIDDDSGWHSELMRRVSIEINGVRPPLWPSNLAAPLRQLRGFRHIVNHANDLTFDPDRLALVMRDQARPTRAEIAESIRGECRCFLLPPITRLDSCSESARPQSF